jgi:phospholipid/cholesterol/gamma-HCH transport system substrate-binding protein
MQGYKGSPLDGILPESRQTVAELNKTMVAFRKLLEDQKLQSKVSDLLTTTNKTLDRFGTLANNVSSLLASNQANFGRAITAATAAVEDVHTVTMKVAEMMRDGKLQKNAVAIVDRMNVISKHADELVENLNKLVNDPKLRGPMATSMSNVAEITNTGKTIANNVADITKNGTTISENAAVVSKKAIILTDKATEIATKASEIEDQLKGVLDKVGGFFNKAPGSKDIPKISTEMDLVRSSQPGYWRTDVSFGIPLQDSTLNFGLYDALSSNKFTVELSKPVSSRLSYRYGVYASSPSVGVDYLLAPRWSLRGDAWDINAARLDLRTGYDMGNGLIGWLGFDRVFHDNAFTIGIGVRR